MDNKLLHLRLGPDEIRTLDELCFTPFSRQQVATMILAAAIISIRENGNKMSFPPKFIATTSDTELILNEKPAKVRR